MNFGSRFVWPGGSSSLDCPVIYDFSVKEMNTCSCIAVGHIYPAGDYTFTWKYYEMAKMTVDSIIIRDLSTTPTTDLKIDVPLLDPITSQPETIVNIPYDITSDSTGTHNFQIIGQGTCGAVMDVCRIEFCLPIFSEGSSNPALTGAEIPSALVSEVKTRYPGTYREFALGYKYWALPASMMETDALSATRPNITFQTARLNTDFVDPNVEMTEFDSTTTFNPMYAMENFYAVNIQWGAGPLYVYNVFRSTHIMHNPMFLEVQDHL